MHHIGKVTFVEMNLSNFYSVNLPGIQPWGSVWSYFSWISVLL